MIISVKKSIWERKYCSYWFLAFRGGVLLCLYHHENFFSQFLFKGGAYYWYLLTLLEFLTIFMLCYFLSKKWFLLLALIPWVIVLLLPANSIVANLVSQANFTFTYPFLIYGYFFHKYRLMNGRTISGKECLGNVCLLAILICLQLFIKADYWSYVRYGVAFSVINIIVYLYVRIVSRIKSISMIGYFGKNSLAIFECTNKTSSALQTLGLEHFAFSMILMAIS